MTPAQQDLVDSAAARLSQIDNIEALWLAGSLGRGMGDEFSDVDLLACCAEGAREQVSRAIVQDFASIASPLLIMELFGGNVISTVTEGWNRLDISLTDSAGLARHDSARLTELFNRSGVKPTGSTPAEYRTTPEEVLRLSNEFIRVLGLARVGLGRGEYQLTMTGVELLRTMTIDLMLEENGVGPWDRGGALKRRPLLTDEQWAQLQALPPLSPDRESAIANNAALAEIFLPRARRLAERTGAEWPAEFERATLDQLESELGLTVRL